MVNRTVLIADDNHEACKLIREAWVQSRVRTLLRMVRDGEEPMNYLRNEGKFADINDYPCPALILLDLNMPKKDGREPILEIKVDSQLRPIPILIFTTSQSEDDILRAYNLGANSFVTKPASFGSLVTSIATMHLYWFFIVHLSARIELVT